MTKLRRSWLITAIAGALFVVAVTSAIAESRQALEYREVTSAATHYLHGELVEVVAPPRHRTRIPVVAG